MSGPPTGVRAARPDDLFEAVNRCQAALEVWGVNFANVWSHPSATVPSCLDNPTPEQVDAFRMELAQLVVCLGSPPSELAVFPTTLAEAYLHLVQLTHRLAHLMVNGGSAAQAWREDVCLRINGAGMLGYLGGPAMSAPPEPEQGRPLERTSTPSDIALARSAARQQLLAPMMDIMIRTTLAHLVSLQRAFFLSFEEAPGGRGVSWGELVSPFGYLSLLAWAAWCTPGDAGDPDVQWWSLTWVKVTPTPEDRIFPGPMKLDCLPTWQVPEALVDAFMEPSGVDVMGQVFQQAEQWAARFARLLEGTDSPGRPAPAGEQNIKSLLDLWNSPESVARRAEHTVTLHAPKALELTMALGYFHEWAHAIALPSMVLFTQEPYPLSVTNTEQPPVFTAVRALHRRPVRLCEWPHPHIWVLLKEEFPWATDTLDQIAMRARFGRSIGQRHFWLPPLLLVGAPGCGKTRLAQRLAQLCEVPSLTLSASGNLGSQLITGSDRHWSNSEPSPVLRVMVQHRVANPLLVIDEVDKSAEDSVFGSFQSALLPLLEPESARCFMDPCLAVPCDLSQVNWLLTANDTSPLMGPLMSRLLVVKMGHPRREHLGAIVQGVRTDLAMQWRVPVSRLPAWTDADTAWVQASLGTGNLFTAREAKRWIERRVMSPSRPALSLVAPPPRPSSGGPAVG